MGLADDAELVGLPCNGAAIRRMKTVAELGEKRIIAEFVKPLFSNSAADQVEVPLGDDCATLRVPAGHSVVVTIDKIPENLIPFRLGLMTMRQLGRYLLVSSLSDLAAMAAQPLASLLSICVPHDFSIADLRDLLEGANDAADAYQCPIVGGDTKGAASWSLVSTALGTVPHGQSLKRSAARPGDVICVTGTAGRVGTALAYFLGRHAGTLSSDDEQFLVDGFRAAVPRLAAAQRLRATGVHACQDISDGIGQTAYEIATASRLRIDLDLERLDLRVQRCVARIAGNSNARALDILTGPGADFELMISLPPQNIEAAATALSDIGIDLFAIGVATEGGGAWVRAPEGIKELRSTGFEHLTGRADDDLVLSRQKQTAVTSR